MPVIYSTLSNSNTYTDYHPGPGVRPIKKRVTVLGGANVMPLRASSGFQSKTPEGVATTVSDEDLEFLKTNPVFKRHLERGLLTVQTKKLETTEVIKNMAKKDQSAPKTPESSEFKDIKRIRVGDA